jgi:hypothetical protein
MTVAFADLPTSIKGMTIRSFDSEGDFYTIVLNSRLSKEQQQSAYEHEMEHINNDDFYLRDCSVDQIEALRHL